MPPFVQTHRGFQRIDDALGAGCHAGISLLIGGLTHLDGEHELIAPDSEHLRHVDGAGAVSAQL